MYVSQGLPFFASSRHHHHRGAFPACLRRGKTPHTFASDACHVRAQLYFTDHLCPASLKRFGDDKDRVHHGTPIPTQAGTKRRSPVTDRAQIYFRTPKLPGSPRNIALVAQSPWYELYDIPACLELLLLFSCLFSGNAPCAFGYRNRIKCSACTEIQLLSIGVKPPLTLPQQRCLSLFLYFFMTYVGVVH